MLIRELLEIINAGLEGTELISLDSPVVFTFGDPLHERILHLAQGGIANALNTETQVNEDIMFFSLTPDRMDVSEAKGILSKLLGKESLKHMKTEGNA